MPIAYEIGTLLEVRGERWRLAGTVRHASCTVLTLEGGNNKRLRLIDPFDRPRSIASASIVRCPRRAVMRSALAAIVDARSPDGLWTASAASMDLWPYQLEPALAAIAGATRLLLADEVGLGKTIQAGLLLSELFERRWVERALIVCPAGLRDTWSRELANRFHLRAYVIDQQAIALNAAELPPGVNPWAGHPIAIASIDFIKRPEVIAAIESEPIDLLIADEAHHLSPGTDRGAVVSRLASRSPWCALVSATPHSGDDAAFEYLTGIGSHDEPLTVFRRSRGDVGLPSGRRTHVLPVTPTEDEARLFAALDRYTRAIWRERGHADRAVRLIALTLARRAASSAAAIERTLTRRRELIASQAPEPAQPSLPWDDEDDADRIEADAMLAVPGMDNAVAEVAALDRLIGLSQRCTVSAKIRRLSRLLDRVREPALIFTEYRDTLDAVCAALRSSRRIGAIHGGIPTDVRRSMVDAFNDGHLDLLVATDAAGEGLNLHHRCRLVIDVELPWNPLRLEQRIGRLDRLGQTQTVHAIRLFHARSIEQRVLEHLRLRDRRAASAFDHHHVTEMAIAGAIFGDESLEVPDRIVIRSTRVPAADTEATRVQTQRRARDLGARPGPGIGWTAPRCAGHSRFLLLHRRSYLNVGGDVIADQLHAHAITTPSRTRRDQRMAIETARQLLNRSTAPVQIAGVTTLAACRKRVQRRVDAIRKTLISDRFEAQASMFDHRIDDLVSARRIARRRLAEGLSRVVTAIESPSEDRVRIDLVAAWPERAR
ncbi:MAG: helicase-related protein [Acidobacteriota bacterium]